MTQTERRRFLLSRLLAEAPEYRQLAVPDDAAGQKQLLRALLNVRPPRDASPEFLQVQDEYLRAELVPHCPHCGKLLTMNLRCDDSFVEDAGWHAAAERYSEFLRRHEGQKILFLELGVGGTPHLRSPCKHRKALLPGLSGTFPFPNPADPVDQHRILL